MRLQNLVSMLANVVSSMADNQRYRSRDARNGRSIVCITEDNH
jgi:hypothetical protein